MAQHDIFIAIGDDLLAIVFNNLAIGINNMSQAVDLLAFAFKR